MNNKFVLRFAFPIIAIFPCFLWACFDKSIWGCDCAMYGLEAIRLWRYLIFQPAGYFHDFITTIGFKAPMISWVGQWFAPFGNWLGYERVFLFMQVIFSALMIFEIIRWKIFSASSLSTIAGILLIASTPFFIFQNHFYFVELSQAFGVLFTFGLYLRRKEVDVVYITCVYFALFFYLLGVKITSPCYIFLPTLGLLHECWLRRKEFRWRELKPWPTKAWFALAIIMTLCVSGWYVKNWITLYHFALSAAHGKIASLYGQKAGLITKLHYWWPNMQHLFWGGRTQGIFEILLMMCLIVNLRQWRNFVDQPLCFAIGQIAIILLAVCLQVNQDARYIYPLLAYWVYVFGRIITQKRVWLIVFSCLFLFRWIEINLGTFGIWPLAHSMPYAQTWDTKGAYVNQAIQVLNKTVDKKNLKTIMTAVEVPQLNENILQFIYFTQHPHAVLNYPIYSIGYAQNSVTQALKNMKNLHDVYAVTLPLSQLKKLSGPFNLVSFALAKRLQQLGWRTFSTDSGYLILKRG